MGVRICVRVCLRMFLLSLSLSDFEWHELLAHLTPIFATQFIYIEIDTNASALYTISNSTP